MQHFTVLEPSAKLSVCQGPSTCAKALKRQKTTGTFASKLVCDALEIN